MKVTISEFCKSKGLYDVVVTHKTWLGLGERSEPYFYVNNSRGGDALISKETGQHVFGKIRERVQAEFTKYRIQKIKTLLED